MKKLLAAVAVTACIVYALSALLSYAQNASGFHADRTNLVIGHANK